MPPDQRKYEHNCGSCVFLEHYNGCDLFFHLHRGTGRVTLKARFGDDMNDYESWGGVMPPPKDWHYADALGRAYDASHELDLFSSIHKYEPILNKRGRLWAMK